MTEPVTLGLIGGLVLAEGVKFLYQQANQILEGRRAGRASHDVPRGTGQGLLRQPLDPDAPVRSLPVPTVELLDELTHWLAPYADGRLRVDPDDENLVAAADAVRRLLEMAYGRELTFREEQREVPTIRGVVEVDEVAGYAAAVRLRLASVPRVSGEVRARSVVSGGEVVGVDVEPPSGR